MKSPARRPRLAVIVANGITGDSRVQKTAVAAARDGWDVTLIGRSDTKRVQRSRLGPIEVVRVPVAKEYLRSVKARKAHPLRGAMTQFRIHDQGALSRYRASYQAWVRQTSAETTWSGRSRRTSLKAVLRARRAVYKLRVRAFKWEQRRTPKDSDPVRDWRLDWPQLVDLDLAFGPVIEELKPDVIHANDATMIVTAARSAARLGRAATGASGSTTHMSTFAVSNGRTRGRPSRFPRPKPSTSAGPTPLSPFPRSWPSCSGTTTSSRGFLWWWATPRSARSSDPGRCGRPSVRCAVWAPRFRSWCIRGGWVPSAVWTP